MQTCLCAAYLPGAPLTCLAVCLQVRTNKRGRFDVRYYYDHLDRLSVRKDNYGNVTQFFYTNHKRPHEVSTVGQSCPVGKDEESY